MKYINELRFKCEVMWIDHSRKICFVTGFVIGVGLLW